MSQSSNTLYRERFLTCSQTECGLRHTLRRQPAWLPWLDSIAEPRINIGYDSVVGLATFAYNVSRAPTNAVEQLIRHFYLPLLTGSGLDGDDGELVLEAEWWGHSRRQLSWSSGNRVTPGHDFHADHDENLRTQGDGTWRFPRYSSVLYLDAEVGGPTLVLNASPTTQAAPLTASPGTGWLIWPRKSRVMWFRGDLVHGVLPEVALKTPRAAAAKAPARPAARSTGLSKVPLTGSVAATRPAESVGRARTTLMVQLQAYICTASGSGMRSHICQQSSDAEHQHAKYFPLLPEHELEVGRGVTAAEWAGSGEAWLPAPIENVALDASQAGPGLQDCGDDAHEHVRQWPHKPAEADPYFPRLWSASEEHWARRKAEAVRQELATLNAEDRRAVQHDLRVQLEDIAHLL